MNENSRNQRSHLRETETFYLLAYALSMSALATVGFENIELGSRNILGLDPPDDSATTIPVHRLIRQSTKSVS